MEKIDYNRLSILIKSSLMSNYSFINKINKKHKKILPIIIIGTIIIIALITLYFISFAKLFKEANKTETIIYMSISISSILIFFTNLMKANSYIFRCKDYDLLTSMPVSTKEIVISKLIVLYITSFLFSFGLNLSSYISYAFIQEFKIINLVMTVALSIIIPLIPIAISSLIAFIIGYLRISKKTKNIIITIIYFLISLIMIMSYINIIRYDENNLFAQVSELRKYFLTMWPFTSLIYKGFYNNDVFSLILYSLGSVIIILIYIIIISKCFVRFNSYERINQKKKDKQITFNNKKIFTSLLYKELKMYTSIPTFVINTMIGPMISIICIVIMCNFIVRNNYTFGFEKLDKLLIDLSISPKEFVVGLLLIGVNMVLTISQISSCSISLEGKSLSITKSLPITKKEIFCSKIVFNYIFFGFFSLISGVILIIIIKPIYYVCLIIVLICSINPLSFSIIGLICNLYLPKLNYTNPIQVVKEGLSVLSNMLISLFMNIFYLGVFIAITIITNVIIGLICLCIISIITLVVSILILKKESFRFNTL